ncbi:SEC-C domain-containing protein [Egibacter rhizosphaerae]|uniref:SEC-C domain-containing protein n=1 Tax=Egibacter rhizosphaerae TaxID=1670831 RepID=A0A411YFM1_9ACTN|nr:SEC-C domain-containing protein [Egibacter rhizosphaerae]QBI19912.1 SEC-C domain-containing protein [Egibacter rhizosphaerae]
MGSDHPGEASDPPGASEALPTLEDEADFLDEQWALAHARAAGVLRRHFPEARGVPAPRSGIEGARERLAAAAERGDPALAWGLAAAELDRADLQEADEPTLVRLVAATIELQGDPGGDPEEDSAVMAIEFADWLSTISHLLLEGPGADADASALAERALADGGPAADGDFDLLAYGFELVVPLWQLVGVLDEERRLTELGAWLLPRAACRAWDSDFDDPDTHQPRYARARGWVRPRDLTDDDPEGEAGEEPSGGTLPLRDGRVVELSALFGRVVATHRLTDEEVGHEALALDPDLPHFRWVDREDLPLEEGGTVGVRYRHDGETSFTVGLVGPAGWLGDAEPGDLVALRLTDGRLAVETVAEADLDTARGEDTVERLAETYVALGASNVAGGPLDLPELLLEAVGADPDLLDRPQPPLGELCDAAGVDLDGDWDWDDRSDLRGYQDALYGEDHPDERELIAREVHGLDEERLAAWHEVRGAIETVRVHGVGALEDRSLVRLGAQLAEPEVAPAVVDDILGSGRGDVESLDALAAVVAPHTTRTGAAACAFLRARCAEHDGRDAEAEGHVEAALTAAGTYGPALLDAAWHAEDRGHAARAARLLRDGGVRDDDAQLVRVTAWAAPAPRRAAGRNEPCPCGSGRKFKKCCGGGGSPPLERRAAWLLDKAAEFAQRPRQRPSGIPLAEACAGDAADSSRLMSAVRGSLVAELALFEGGLLERFLARRGEFLPLDERDLARRWLDSPRRLIDPVAGPADGKAVLRDAQSGEEFDALWSFDEPAPTGDEAACARLLDTGNGHLVGRGVVRVPSDERSRAASVLASDPDALDLALWVGSLVTSAPVTVDGDPMIRCRATYRVPEPAAAGEALSAHFEEAEPGTWLGRTHVHGASWRSGTITLDGDRALIETLSEARQEHVQAAFLRAVPAATSIDEWRRSADQVGRD